MCEVIKSNFESYLPSITDVVKKAEFVAIDTEFTGLQLNEQNKPSLFDGSEERYRKLKNCVSQFLVCQIGISAFVKEADNKYLAYTFNFPLFPTSFGPVDVRFQCQASSLKFLCQFKFDFQKFIYEGVSYMNESQEHIVREHMSSNAMFLGLERDADEHYLQKICSQVAEWFVSSKMGDTLTVHCDKGCQTGDDYVVHSEIRNRFPSVWTVTDPFGKIVVERISAEKRKTMEEESRESQRQQEEQLINTMLGFTRVFRLLIELKKILVGHNMLMDLMFMHEKFFKPLPEKYCDFKRNIHEMFPIVFDTKHFCTQLKKPFEQSKLLESTSLGDLYLALDSSKGKLHILCQPDIIHAPGFQRYNGVHSPHEAGYDAYQCGYVFLRIAHMVTFKDTKSMNVTPCSFDVYLKNTTKFQNSVNIIRAMINYINLDKEDPPSKRPQLLFVTTRKYGQSLKTEQLGCWFSKYGTVDIRLQGRQKALVATGNFSCAKDILRSFRHHEVIRVTYYNIWKHSTLIRGLMWTGVAASGGLCLWVLLSSSKNS
ncbi:poly(A)-specific ribonuclease PNLDC1-like [Gigantopelta aegis]|uniref:poly(A)-specific ribonuclease PNLDC1-like n=1 Tax=Gigantopelta aegis TaxID=1735272 RepID=UPI001B88D536|nr:poly(A)-specific ribonuclease PNLDC1-like [Gigantopelta aegis]